MPDLPRETDRSLSVKLFFEQCKRSEEVDGRRQPNWTGIIVEMISNAGAGRGSITQAGLVARLQASLLCSILLNALIWRLLSFTCFYIVEICPDDVCDILYAGLLAQFADLCCISRLFCSDLGCYLAFDFEYSGDLFLCKQENL